MDEIRRNDRFVAYAKSNISATDYQILSLFYQPIIGVGAFTLYCTLMNLLDRQSLVSEDYLHGDLESLLNTKLTLIEKDRHRLEAIGLMDSFYSDDHFAYELKLPLSAQSFVNDGILGQYLIAAITIDRFKKLLHVFKLRSPSLKKYVKTTKSFDEVFPSLKLQEQGPEADLKSGGKPNGIKTSDRSFDWRLFTESVPKDFLKTSDLNEELKNKILNLHYVYGLDELDMREVFLQALDKDNVLSVNKMASAARDSFRLKQSEENKVEIPDSAPVSRNLPAEPVAYFQVVTPRELLEEIGGGRASSADLRIVERLLEETGINHGVLNVLLAYVARIKDGTLPGYDYFEKVALDWKRNQIETVETAVEYVKHLRAKYEHAKETSSGGRTYRQAKSNRPDVEVDWLEDYIKSIQ